MAETKYTTAMHRQYLNMLSVVGTRWQNALPSRPEYHGSVGWGLLTNLWGQEQEKVKMSTAYSFLRELKSPTTQRLFITNAIKAGIVDCDEDFKIELMGSDEEKKALKKRQAAERKKAGRGSADHGRRGKNSPDIWLAAEVRQRLDVFFDEAIDELIKAADTIRSQKESAAT